MLPHGGRVRARALAIAGLVATCLLVAVVISSQVHKQRQTLLGKDNLDTLASIEQDTFRSPESIYKSELSKIRKSGIPTSESLAWAGRSHSTQQLSQKLPSALARVERHLARNEDSMRKYGIESRSMKQLEQAIASDVTRQVLSKLDRVLPGRREIAKATVHKQRSVDRKVDARLVSTLERAEKALSADKQKEKRDERAAKELLRHMNSLANTYEEPQNPKDAEETRAPMPLSDGMLPTAKGPSDTHNYWLGDHYHDDEGPRGVRIHTSEESNEAEESAEDGESAAEPAQESGGDSAEGSEGADPWARGDNREKLQKLGVNVMSSTPDWLGSAKSSDEHDDKETSQEVDRIKRLNTAGVVTDRLPGLGEEYRSAIPNPSYENFPTSETVSQDLEKGHRYVDEHEHKLRDAGINVASNNILLPAEDGGKNEEQRKFPYLDGIEDHLQAKDEARQHKPLWFLIDNIKKGSEKLEDHGVNVWGSPISLNLPKDFFDRTQEDEGGQKLKALGVRVNRYSMVPEHGAVPHGEDKHV